MAKQIAKIEGPYKVLETEEGLWKIVKVIGQYRSLETIEKLYQRTQTLARNPRPVRPHRPNQPDDHIPPTSPFDEAYWAQQCLLAGKERTQDLKGKEGYARQEEALRDAEELNKQWMEDLAKSVRELRGNERARERAYQKKRAEEGARMIAEHEAWHAERYEQKLQEQREQQARRDEYREQQEEAYIASLSPIEQALYLRFGEKGLR